MPIDTAFYLATEDVTRRCRLLGQRYITQDGRYVLDNKDLARIRLTSEEFINGLQGIESVGADEAKLLIAKGGYNMQPPVSTQEEEEEQQEEEQETEE